MKTKTQRCLTIALSTLGASARAATQFLQVENQLVSFIDRNVASEMPVVGNKAK